MVEREEFMPICLREVMLLQERRKSKERGAQALRQLFINNRQENILVVSIYTN